MHITEYFNLARTQATVDFVDVDTSTDARIFIDPRAISLQNGDWAEECKTFLASFFSEVLDAIHIGQPRRVRELMERLGEPNETHLGFSRGRSRGRGLGFTGTAQMADSISGSKAAQTGLLEDLEDTALLVPGIGPDIIADITTHVIRGALIGYTQRACEYYDIPLEEQHSGPVWNPDALEWQEGFVDLPRTPEGELLLVPKSIVRHNPIFDTGTYYLHYIAPMLEAEELQANTQLVKLLKNGTRKVDRTALKQKYGDGKLAVVDQTLRFDKRPLQEYRRSAGVATSPALDNDDLVVTVHGQTFDYMALYEQMVAISPGNAGATLYHRSAEKLVSAVFYPSLGNMRMEQEIHEGRKRIDICYDNIATIGFFEWLNRNYRCPTMPVECKNYSRELSNPELDQLSGRFSNDRGQVGVLVCRSFDNKDRFIARCRDTAKDGRGYILVLDDDDLKRLASEAAGLRRERREKQLAFPMLRDRFQILIS